MAKFLLEPAQIKYWRLRRNLSQQEFADAIHVSRVTVNRWEKGIQMPPLSLEDTLWAIRDLHPQRVSYFNSPDLYVRHFDKRRRKVHYTIKPEFAHLRQNDT